MTNLKSEISNLKFVFLGVLGVLAVHGCDPVCAIEISRPAAERCAALDGRIEKLQKELAAGKEVVGAYETAHGEYEKQIADLERQAEDYAELDKLQERRIQIKEEYISFLEKMLEKSEKARASERRWAIMEKIGQAVFMIALFAL